MNLSGEGTIKLGVMNNRWVMINDKLVYIKEWLQKSEIKFYFYKI